MTDNPAKYFDKILLCLSKEYNRIYSFSDVLHYLHYDNNKEPFPTVPGESHGTISPEQNDNFLNAIMFLGNEKLIWYDITKAQICIQTAGFIKIKTKGFQKEIKYEKYSLWLNWFNNIVTPLMALAAFILSLIALLSGSEPNSNSDKDNTHQQENTK